MSANSEDKIYFGGLNGLRFFAATAVIFHHIEQYKLWARRDGYNYPSVFGGDSAWSVFFDALGHKAVSLFFVLSGFLITYLLLAEVKKTNTVSLGKFYLRRILRIWPVYYLVILLTFFVIPHFFDVGQYGQGLLNNHFWVWLGLCMFMLPNLVRYNTVELVGGNQTWSVGIEEQFYLIWPWLVRTFHKNFERMLIIFIVVKMSLYAIGLLVAANTAEGTTIHLLATKFHLHWALFKIEQMAVGALVAYYLFNKNEQVLKLLYNKAWIWACVILFISFFVTELHFFGHTIFEALVAVTLILNVSTNPNCWIKFRWSGFTMLGNISYGIYMYHTLVLAVLINVAQHYKIDQDHTTLNWFLYIGGVAGTLLISWLSYRYFESFFLTIKERFMVVKSSSKG